MSPPASLDSCTGQFPSSKSSSASYSSYTNMNSSSSNSNYAFPNSNQRDTIFGFNSPPLADSRNPGGATVAGSGSNLSRPRLMKMRRQASHNPRSTTAFGIRRGEEADASLGFNPFRTSSESSFVDPGMENVPKRAFSFGAGSSNNPSFSFQASERENNINLDESMVDQLPHQINKLNISGSGNSLYTNTFPSNNASIRLKDFQNQNKKNLDESMVDQLPNQINNLNIGVSGNVNPMKGQFTNKFPSNVETELQHELHRMNLGNPGNVGWGSNNHKSSVFGKNSKSDEHLFKIPEPVIFGKQHDEEKVKADLISDRMGKMKVSESGEDNSKTFIFGATSKTREDIKADVISDKMQDLKVSGSGNSSGFSISDNKIKSDTFTFTSKLDDLKAPNVETKTPMESVKGSKLRKKKGKTRKHVTGQTRPTQNFVFGQTSVEILEGFEAYSPMDVSPYQETLADDYYYRETSVTSDDNTSQMNDHNSFSSESFIVHSNLATDEDLLVATQCLDLNDDDVKCEVSEAESFRSANENLDYSSDTFASAFDTELSSTATSSRKEESNTRLFKFGSKLENINKENFTFAASSSSQSQLSPDTRQHKKKHRLKTGHDSSTSTSDSKNDFFPIPVNNPSLFSPNSVPILSRKNNDSFRSINQQDPKHGAFSTSSASIAAEESCEKWRLRGNQAYGNGDLAKAEDYYTQGLNSVPQTEKSRDCLRALMLCYSNRAATRISLGKMRDALKDCLMAAAIDPNFLKVQVRAANCYLAIGEVENATHQYMKCLQSGNDVCVDRKLLVEASEGLAKAQKVTECIKQYTELPRRTWNELESALRVINEALQISNFSEQLLQMKAEILIMLRRYEQVIQMCEQTFNSAEVDTHRNTQTPTSPNSWRSTLIVKSYFNLGRLEEALEFIKKQETSGQITERLESMSLDSVIPLANTIRELLSRKAAGNEAYKSGKYTEAVEHYSAALSCSVESRPFAAICFCNRAAAYGTLGQITDAIADCSLAIALDPTYLKAISRRASLYEMIRDYGQAANDLRRFVSLLRSQTHENSILDKSNEIRQTQIRISNIEEESRKEIPLNMYLILGVESTADASEVKKAYRKAALKHHPDKAALSLSRSDNGDDGIWKEIAENVYKDADRLFKMIGEAYAVLSNPSKRSRYDMDEEMRNEANNFTNISQSPVFERSGSRRWQDSWRPYVHTQSKSQEKSTPSYRYSRQT